MPADDTTSVEEAIIAIATIAVATVATATMAWATVAIGHNNGYNHYCGSDQGGL
jgi:hypothetical protein